MSPLLATVWLGVWALAAAAAWSLFRVGRGALVVLSVLALVLVEVVLYVSQNDIDGGIVNPDLGGGVSFGLVDVSVTAAIVGAILAVGFRIPTLPAALWICLCAWLLVSAGIGLARGFDPELVGFSSRVIVYLAFAVVVREIPARDYVHGRWPATVVGLGALLSVLLLANAAAAPIPWVPLEEVQDAGGAWASPVGGDAATVLFGLGLIAAVRAVVDARRGVRLGLLAVAGPMLAVPLASTQRAALAGVAAAIVVVGAALLSRRWRRRIRLSRSEIAMGVGIVLAAMVVLVGARVAAGDAASKGVASPVTDAFTATGKSATAEARRDQWREALSIFGERPVVGQGLGFEYTVALPSLDEVRTTGLTHNVALDLLVRSGVIGVVLALAALAATYLSGLSAWRSSRSDLLAALAIGGVAVLTSLLVKGMFESAMEKYRLMAFFAVVLAALLSTAIAVDEETDEGEGGVASRAEPPRAATPQR